MKLFRQLFSYCDDRMCDDAATWLKQQRDKEEEDFSQDIETFTVKGVDLNMVRVQCGTFLMGATEEQGSDAREEEKPVHSVTLSDYCIGQTPVTQQLWEAVMDSTTPYCNLCDQCPAECVSWNDCQKFIRKLNRLTGRNFRLPTEAEWEFAARGGNKSRGYKYSGSNRVDDVAWHNGNCDCKTRPVAIKQANELGLYDMSGNVWEWCSDWYGEYSEEPQTNPQGPSFGSKRVLRGGCSDHFDIAARNTARIGCIPSDDDERIGLRLAL